MGSVLCELGKSCTMYSDTERQEAALDVFKKRPLSGAMSNPGDPRVSTTLSAQFASLERLHEHEVRKWWEVTSLQNYVAVGRVPRGIRIYTVPAYENPDPKLLAEWAEHTADSCKGMLLILIKFAWSDYDKARKAINELENEIAQDGNKSRQDELRAQMVKRLKSYETKIRQRKQEKFERDERDYAMGRILTFPKCYDAPRKEIQNRNRAPPATSEQGDTTDSEVSDLEQPNVGNEGASSSTSGSRFPFHDEFQIIKQSWQKGTRGKPPEVQRGDQRGGEASGERSKYSPPVTRSKRYNRRR